MDDADRSVYRVVLHVSGVRLETDDAIETIGSSDRLAQLEWQAVDGRTLVTLYLPEHDVYGGTVQVSRQISHAFAGATVELDQDLVSITDIANRIDLTREAVRLWVRGARGPGNFPVCVGSVGGGDRGSTQVWCWADVNLWLQRHLRLGDGFLYLDAKEAVRLSSALLSLEDYVDLRWSEVDDASQRLVLEVNAEPLSPLADWSDFEWAIDVDSQTEVVRQVQ